MNLNLFSCPYDALKVYDYQKPKWDSNQQEAYSSSSNNRVQKIGKTFLKANQFEKHIIDSYCGRKLNFTLYSTNNLFEIEFEMSNSLGNEEYSEDENRILLRKGFKAHFKFSKYFADLGFITGTHITGTSNNSRFPREF
jgi:hypothetical protein